MGDGGADDMHGQAGNDYLDGGAGNDEMHGGDGDDTMLGSTDDNVAHGDEANDVYGWSPGYAKNDVFHGGPGNNTVRIQFVDALTGDNDFVFNIDDPDKGAWVNGDLVFQGPVSGTITIAGNTLTFFDVQRITDLPPRS